MKMSKSINDYKEAMDNIKISESFYKRTEVMLTELPEVKIEKRPAVNGRRVSAVIMSAAACVICLFGVKLALDGRQTNIVTETASDVSGEAGSVTETDRGADELIDDLSDYDDAGITAESIVPDNPDGGDIEQDVTEESKPAAVKPAASPETSVPEDISVKANTTTAPPPKNDTEKSTSAAEKHIAQGTEQSKPSANASQEPKDKDAGADKKPAELPNPGVSGNIEYDDEDIEENAEEAIMDDADEEFDEALPTASAGGTASAKLFSELSTDNITVDITPYFNMENIKSGEGTVKKSGTEFKPVLDLISNMDSSATKIGNGSFTSLFSIRIYDENIGLDFYSIYLTNQGSIVITKHSPDGSQVRETYALRKEYYEAVKYQLFLIFGTEGDYELFSNLIGGK